MSALAWLYWCAVQVGSFVFRVIGIFVLPFFCLARAWVPVASELEAGRMIDRWSFGPLNWIYGNTEDGVSGACALIWGSGADAGKLVPYMPDAWPPWRAYCWSAWRNSTGGWQELFRWRWQRPPPFIAGRWILGRQFKLGWQKEIRGLVPVFSL